MFDLKSLKPFLVGLFIIFVMQNLFDQTETFAGRVCSGAQCPQVSGANNMCHTLASGNCQIPQAQLNDCWLNAYTECSQKGSSCDCADAASMKCQGRRCDDPALACYASVHQKCMAGMGFASDPDRGSPQINGTCNN